MRLDCGQCCCFVYHLSGLSKLHTLQTLHKLILRILLTGIRQANKEKRGSIFKRAESYVKEYRDAEHEKIRLRRLSKQNGSFYVDEQPKLAFVIRIKG